MAKTMIWATVSQEIDDRLRGMRERDGRSVSVIVNDILGAFFDEQDAYKTVGFEGERHVR